MRRATEEEGTLPRFPKEHQDWILISCPAIRIPPLLLRLRPRPRNSLVRSGRHSPLFPAIVTVSTNTRNPFLLNDRSSHLAGDLGCATCVLHIALVLRAADEEPRLRVHELRVKIEDGCYEEPLGRGRKRAARRDDDDGRHCDYGNYCDRIKHTQSGRRCGCYRRAPCVHAAPRRLAPHPCDAQRRRARLYCGSPSVRAREKYSRVVSLIAEEKNTIGSPETYRRTEIEENRSNAGVRRG